VPVIYTKNTGTDDVVESMKTGFSINGSLEELLVTLTALKKDDNLRKRLSSSARERALTLWRQDVVAAQYLNLYQSLKGM
jgi:glycosyltransferase involved in cell wall biosynthesis